MAMRTCRANRHGKPDPKLPVGEWLRAAAKQILGYEPCGKPATHVAYGGSKPLCDDHAEELRRAMKLPDTVANIARGRAATDEEIARMVQPIH